MATMKLPYIQWRDGQPRFTPSKREVDLGFPSEDLRHPGGRWFTFEEAAVWSTVRLEEIKQARLAGRRKDGVVPVGETVGDLIRDWLEGLEVRVADNIERMSLDTLKTYRKAATALLYKPENRHVRWRRLKTGGEPEREPFGRLPVRAIDKILIKEMFFYLARKRGHSMAQCAIASLSAAWTWGQTDRRWRLKENPRHGLDLPRPQGRIVIYTDTELAALVAAADAIDRASIGDAIYLGVFTAQRQRDRLLLADEPVDGRHCIRQSKTRALVQVPMTVELATRLDNARVRVAAIKLAKGTRPDTIVVDEATGLPYVQDTYRHWFAEVRALALKGSNELGLAPCPSLQFTNADGDLMTKTDQDLRDTAVTWLARAGCTLMELCAISGHSAESVQTIIKHYLDMTGLADAAVGKLQAWIEREGIRL